MTSRTAASLLRDARRAAGLSQRALAARAWTSQSVVARIELGRTDPSFRTLQRLLAAADFDLDVALAPRDRRVPLDPSYLDDVKWAEQRPENQSGADKTWVGRLQAGIRELYERAVRVR